jgi:hypothetical protein
VARVAVAVADPSETEALSTTAIFTPPPFTGPAEPEESTPPPAPPDPTPRPTDQTLELTLSEGEGDYRVAVSRRCGDAFERRSCGSASVCGRSG